MLTNDNDPLGIESPSSTTTLDPLGIESKGTVQKMNGTSEMRAWTPYERYVEPITHRVHDAIMGPAVQPEVGIKGALPNVAQALYGNVKPEVSKGQGLFTMSPSAMMREPQSEAEGIGKGLMSQVNVQNLLLARMLGPILGATGMSANLAKAGLGAYFTEQGVEQGAQAAGRRYSGAIPEGEKGTEDIGMIMGAAQAAGGPFMSMPTRVNTPTVKGLPDDTWYAGPKYQLKPARAGIEVSPSGEATDVQGAQSRAKQASDLKIKQQFAASVLRQMKRSGVDIGSTQASNDPLGIEIKPEQQQYEQANTTQEETKVPPVRPTGTPANQTPKSAPNVPAEVRQGANATGQGRPLIRKINPTPPEGQPGYGTPGNVSYTDPETGFTVENLPPETTPEQARPALQQKMQRGLVPAIATESGIIKATSDEQLSHDDVLKANKIEPAAIKHEDPRRGFVDSQGKWYTREQAEKVTGLKGTAEAGGLDSMDLPRASYEKGVHAEDWKNAQAAASKTGTKLYGGLFFLDPDFWKDQVRIAGNVKTDGQMLYNRMRNALGKDSAAWKSVDTDAFRKMIVSAGRISPDEVKNYLDLNKPKPQTVAELIPQISSSGKLFSGVPLFDPESLGIDAEQASKLKEKYLKSIAAKGQSLPGDLTSAAKQFAPKSARAAAILGSTTARSMTRTQELIAQPGEKLGAGERAMNLARRIGDIAKEGDKVVNPWDVLYDWMDGGKAKYNGPLMENIRKPLDSDFNDELNLRSALLDPVRNLIKKHKMDHVQSERIGVYLNTLQEGGYDRMVASGIDPVIITKIQSNLTEAERAVALEIRKTYDTTFPLIQKVAKDVDNINLNPVDNYFSWEREWRKYKPEADELASPKVRSVNPTVDDVLWPGLEDVRTRVKPGSIEKRVPGAATPIKIDAFSILDRYTRDAAHYIAMRRHLKEISEIVRDDEFASKYGDEGQALIMEHLNTIARQGRYKRNGFLDGLRKLTSRGVIAYRLPSQFVHLANIPLGMQRAGVARWYKGLDEALSDEGQAFLRRHFAETFERGGGEPALREVAEGNLGKQSMYHKVSQAGFWLQRKIDQLNAQATVIGVYMRELEKKGLKPEDYAELPVDKKAVEQARVEARRAVASPLYKDVPPLLNRGGSLTKSLMQFQNTFLDQWSNIRYDLAQVGLPESIKGNPKLAMQITAALAAMLLVETGVKYGYKQALSKATGAKQREDDTFAKTLEHEALRRIPGMGQLQSQIVYGETGIPSIDALEEPIKQGIKYAKSTDKASKTLARTRAVGALAEVAGIPGASQATDIIGGVERGELFKSHTERLEEQEGKGVEKMTLKERYAAEKKYKKNEPPMSKSEQASAAERSIGNINKRGEEIAKELDKPTRQWVESRGLTIPGYYNSVPVSDGMKASVSKFGSVRLVPNTGEVFLDDSESKKLHEYIKQEYISVINTFKSDKKFDTYDKEEQKIYFNEALLAARSRARFKMMQEMSRSVNERDKEKAAPKKFSIFNP